MTTTEPELTLIALTDRESEVEPSRWGLVARAFLGSLGGVLLSVLLSLFFFQGSYAGVQAEGAAERAVAAYRPYLEAIGRQLAWLGLAQALCFAPAVLGLLLLLRVHPRARSWTRGRVLLPSLLGLLVVSAFGSGVAHRHPGLFLSQLTGNGLLMWSARQGVLLVVLVFGAAALGYLFTALRPRQQLGVALACWAALVLPVAAWLVTLLAPGPVRVFGGASLAGGAAAEKPAEDGSEESVKAALLPAPKAEERQPNVLVLAVDSLRPDMLDVEHTPHLSRLLEESIYFPNTLVTQPRTGPSWAATLTSLPPLQNGVETMFPSSELNQLQTLALPAHLGTLGYRTAVFSEYAGEFFSRVNFGFQLSAVPHVELEDITGQMLLMRVPSLLAAASAFYTHGQGGRAVLGQRLDNLVRGMANFAWPEVLQDDMLSLAELQRREAEEKGEPAPPFFWLTFYSQPHFPYTSSSDFHSKYAVDGAAPELRFGRDATNETPITTDADKGQLVGLYRAALAETDAAIGQLLTRLEAARLLEDTIIVLLSDHGEGLYECARCVGHGDNLQSLVTLRVPLAFRLPKQRFPDATPARQEGYVSQLDLYPTLLSLLAQPPAAHHAGVALLDGKGLPRPVPQRTHFAETGEWLWPTPAVPADRIAYPVITEMAKLERGRIVIDPKYNPEIRAGKQRAVIRPPYKLSYEPGASQVQYHLYHFEEDPWEQQDLAASQPQLVDELKRALFRSMLRHPQVLALGDYFLSRPAPPPPENY